MDTVSRSRFFESVCQDAHEAPDVASFRSALVQRLAAAVGFDSAVTIPARYVLEPAGPAREGDRPRYAPALAQQFRAMRRESVVVGRDVFGPEGRRNLMWREILEPGGVGSYLSAVLAFHGGAHVTMNLQRSRKATPFGAPDAETIRALLPLAAMADAAIVARCTPARRAPGTVGRPTLQSSSRDQAPPGLVPSSGSPGL